MSVVTWLRYFFCCLRTVTKMLLTHQFHERLSYWCSFSCISHDKATRITMLQGKHTHSPPGVTWKIPWMQLDPTSGVIIRSLSGLCLDNLSSTIITQYHIAIISSPYQHHHLRSLCCRCRLELFLFWFAFPTAQEKKTRIFYLIIWIWMDYWSYWKFEIACGRRRKEIRIRKATK